MDPGGVNTSAGLSPIVILAQPGRTISLIDSRGVVPLSN
ncbi:hypothetical protein FRUB_01224 [Fimbriiglobus ruber]|uniref:Uncharacterized protein n=1 Tax=Fimbriiglobus ruber TaxID=1908690 RepID=A0A225EGU1_9BACT|nr:hypothetical protein FRUB_01224 [Fimbriiglobus ruber]